MPRAPSSSAATRTRPAASRASSTAWSRKARREGCEGGGFFLFGGGSNASSQQCVDLNRQISNMRGNLDRINVDLQRLRGSDGNRGEARQSVLGALAQNNCGAQYRTAARAPGGFLDQIFGRDANEPSRRSRKPRGRHRHVPHHLRAHLRRRVTSCLLRNIAGALPRRRKDLPAPLPECRGRPVLLPHHGEELAQATSISGQPYTQLPNAFNYRQEFNPACSCKKPGQSWAEAVGKDGTSQPATWW